MTPAQSPVRNKPAVVPRRKSTGRIGNHPATPDGRYFVVRGRLWRMANPGLDEADRADLVGRLMAALRAVRDAKKSADREAEVVAHRIVDEVKRALGERGPPWWDDGSPDFNRHLVKNTPYADWYRMLDDGGV